MGKKLVSRQILVFVRRLNSGCFKVKLVFNVFYYQGRCGKICCQYIYHFLSDFLQKRKTLKGNTVCTLIRKAKANLFQLKTN